MIEIWKDVVGFEKMYQVSNLGRIKSLSRLVRSRGGTRMIKGKILNQTLNKRTGYLQCGILKKGIQVHREVAICFVDGYSPELVVNHKNGVKTDNIPDNLEWVTSRHNNLHARKMGLVNDNGENSSNSKLKNWQVFYIKYCWNKKGITKLAKKFGINYKTIYKISDGSRWAHI